MFSINCAAPSGLATSLQCRTHKAIRAPHPNVRVICGSHNGSATAYPVSDLKMEIEKSEKAQVTETGPAHVMTLAERMRVGGLMKEKFAYKECFVVRSYEVGSNKSATMETILNLIQETSCNHAQSWGWMEEGEFPTLPSMKKNRLIWVNCQMHVQMDKYPGWGDVVEIEHWCEAEGRLAARFDYIIRNMSSGEVIGRATSKWLMINRDTRKPQRLNNQVREEFLAICSKSSRLAFPEENRSLKKIPKLEEPAEYSRLNLVPRRSDLNMNSHVNSITYFSLLLEVCALFILVYRRRYNSVRKESMPQDIIDKYELQSITIDYRHNCRFNDSLDSYTSSEIERETMNGFSNDLCLLDSNPNPGRHRRFLHSLKLSRTGQETNRGCTSWRKH